MHIGVFGRPLESRTLGHQLSATNTVHITQVEVLSLVITRKAQLMQRGTRNSGACLKVRCEQKLNSPILATMFLLHSPESARQQDRSRSVVLA